jgi:hypothetical protein
MVCWVVIRVSFDFIVNVWGLRMLIIDFVVDLAIWLIL